MQKIILIGSGNVAHHLGNAFCNAGHKIVQVISKSDKNAKVLAQKLNTGFDTDINKIKKADFAIVATNDDAIARIASQIKNMPCAHTSGSVTLEKVGVFYPLQTFSKEVPLDLEEVPLCVSAEDKIFEVALIKLAKSISNQVFQISEKQRKALHLAAVFACNFSNQMYIIAEELLKKSDLDFEMIKPLIAETAKKINEQDPQKAQTGPAKRKDLKTIKNQIALLKNDEFKKIYKLITAQILKQK